MSRNNPLRNGFTLVEMLVVIVIIGILMGILLVAVGPVRRSAYNFAINSEIKELEGGINDFKTKFGFFPPSEFDFDADGTSDLSTDAEDLDTFKQYLRRIAPNHEQTDAQITTWWTDVGSALDNDSILVFWLSGLKKNAQYPLTDSTGVAYDGFANGDDPENYIFFNFDGGQLVAGNNARVRRYLQRRIGDQPYVYFDWQRYASAECSVTDIDSTTTPITHDIYPYRTNPVGVASPYYNPDSFQIIAAGVDSVFGAVAGPPPADDWTVKNPAPSLVNFTYHRDNITNFSGGVLEREVQ